VVVDNHILCVVVLWCEETVHPAWFEEAVVQHDGRVADLAQVVVRVTIKALDHLFVQFNEEWFVQDLNGDNNVLHRWGGILLLNFSQSSMCVAKAICITPAGNRGPVTAVIEPVLRLWCAVEVDDHLQASLSCPVDRRINIRSSTLCVRSPRIHVAPVSNGYAHQIEASILDFPEVIERHETVPMRFEHISASLLTDLLTQSPFIDDGIIGCTVTLEDGGCNEAAGVNIMNHNGCNNDHSRFKDQPSTKVDAANFIAAPVEVDTSFVEITGEVSIRHNLSLMGSNFAGAALTMEPAAVSRIVNESCDRMVNVEPDEYQAVSSSS
jgi:hypothetical protein